MKQPKWAVLSFPQLFPLWIAVFIDILGFSILIPFLPFFGKQFDMPPWQIGLLLSTNALFSFFSGPIWGTLERPLWPQAHAVDLTSGHPGRVPRARLFKQYAHALSVAHHRRRLWRQLSDRQGDHWRRRAPTAAQRADEQHWRGPRPLFADRAGAGRPALPVGDHSLRGFCRPA